MNRRHGFVLVFIFLLYLTSWGQQSKPAVPPGRKPGVKAKPGTQSNKGYREANLNEAGLEPFQLVASVASGSSIHLYWNDEIEHERSFVIERSVTYGNPGFVTVREVGANTTAYVDEGLQPGVYYYRVYATQDGVPPIYSSMASVA